MTAQREHGAIRHVYVYGYVYVYAMLCVCVWLCVWVCVCMGQTGGGLRRAHAHAHTITRIRHAHSSRSRTLILQVQDTACRLHQTSFFDCPDQIFYPREQASLLDFLESNQFQKCVVGWMFSLALSSHSLHGCPPSHSLAVHQPQPGCPLAMFNWCLQFLGA